MDNDSDQYKTYELKICVSSVKNYSDKTIPIIVPSLIESGVDPKKIYVFEGGNTERKILEYDTHTLIKTNHNTLEYTGLIDIVEYEMESDYWFNIQDTCRVGKNFWKLVNNIPNNYPDKISLRTWPSMSMGAIKYQYLIKHKNRLVEIKNKDYSRYSIQKLKNWAISEEDYMFHKLQDSLTCLYNPEMQLEVYEHKKEDSWYGGVPRIIEYYPQLDLYKSKSNWERKSLYEIDL
jgi:hypothetical protein